MKQIEIAGNALLMFALFGATTTAVIAQPPGHDKQDQRGQQQQQSQSHQAQPQPQQQQHQPQAQRAEPQQRAQPEQRGQPQQQSRQPQPQQQRDQHQPQQSRQAQPQPQHDQHQQQARQPQGQQRDQHQPSRQAESQRGPQQQQRSQYQQHAQQVQQRNVWQQHRASNWESQRRSWQQRGGYRGFHVPDVYFNSYYGSNHSFNIYGLPFMVVGGDPRFQYRGYWFTFMDPYPEYWGPSWYQTDDVFIDYRGDGYYLFNRRYPGRPGIAIDISL